jgi:hypothetical protein
MLALLVGMTLLLTAADHWTTYLCLRAPVTGWQVTEANPLAEWLFGSVGLVEGLLVDSVVSLVAIAFLLTTSLVPSAAKHVFFGFVVLWTGWAVLNNLQALSALGLSPWGGA